MDEAEIAANDQWIARNFRRNAWSSLPTPGSPSGSSSSTSSDKPVRPTTARTVGPRVAHAVVPSADQTQRHVHHHRRWTGETVAYLEIQNVMELVQRKLFTARTWQDASNVMRLVMSNCIMSVLCAWVTVLLYAFASPWSPFIPEWTWSAPAFAASNLIKADHFDAVVGFYFVLIACVVYLVTKSFTVDNRLFTFSAGDLVP